MQKTFQKILDTKPWVRRIVDERKHGGSIIVTLYDSYIWNDSLGCSIQTFDTMKEVKQKTNFDCVVSADIAK
jgi:hypothetical protein